MNGDDAFARRPRDDAQYQRTKLWVMTKLGNRKFQGHPPPLLCSKRAARLPRNDFVTIETTGSGKVNYRGQSHKNVLKHCKTERILFVWDDEVNVERPSDELSAALQRIFPKIMPKKPAEEENGLKEVPEASGPQNDGKQLCPREIQVPWRRLTRHLDPKGEDMPSPTDCVRESSW
ncbi:SSX4B isoform 2 [Pan troglodytes]|uniref:SSX4B isoform 2 n=1 Tax=Pan troglodytes TaxID=9598 RepID=A0A2J8IU81_PANTR|nr:SSX4B isoform 2 [Pan troglodytes]